MSKAPHVPAVDPRPWSVQRTKTGAEVSAGERDAIARFMAEKGVRKCDEAETGDRRSQLDWLQMRGLDVHFHKGKSSAPQTLRWRYGDRLIGASEFDALVAGERARTAPPA